MSQTVTIEVPESIAERFASPAELRESVLEGLILSEFQRGFLSIRESAKLLGLSYEGFLERLNARGISFILASPGELNSSYQDFEAFLRAGEAG